MRMDEEDEEDEGARQIEWFHRLAALPREQLTAQATDANRLAFYTFIDKQLPDNPGPTALGPEEFADAVLALRENQRRWNRALGNAIIKADEVAGVQGARAAIEILWEFAQDCPWQSFREIAASQAACYLPDNA